MKRAKKTPRYVICIRTKGCEDLTLRKVYEVLPDEAAAKDDHLRVADESGEDYLYPATCFIAIELPKASAEAMAHAA
jgi:hypothetical protein